MSKHLIHLLNCCYMKIIRLLLFTGVAVLAIAWLSRTKIWERTVALYGPKQQVVCPVTNNIIKKLEQKAATAKLFVQKKNYNENTCFLIDMSLPSGQNRFFVYDLKKNAVQSAGLVAHGNCFQSWLEGRKYSNVVGSGCTSLGKYKIGNSYTGKFGYSYKLYGLDSMNNNAFERTVVLHSYTSVPETEVSNEICQSNGCPMVSPKFFQKLTAIINASKKPVLLWIYE